MLSESLTRHLTTKLLSQKASRDAFRTGRRLMARGLAEITGSTRYVTHATVTEEAKRSYDLWFRATATDLECTCECRKTVKGACCKHVVAAGLAALRLAEAQNDGLIN